MELGLQFHQLKCTVCMHAKHLTILKMANMVEISTMSDEADVLIDWGEHI